MPSSRKATAGLASKLMTKQAARAAVILGASLAGAWFAFAFAASGVTLADDPKAALRFDQNDGAALALRADQLILANPDNPPRQVQALALAALRAQPVNARALRVLGFYAEAKGDLPKAEAYVGAAETLSRRDLGAQLWLLEASVRKGNLGQVLRHYDIALRTNPETQAILFPQLLAALDDAEIRKAVTPYIKAKDGWGAGFLSYATANSQDLPILVDLMVESGGLVDKKAAQDQETQLLSRLVAEKYFADARRLFLLIPGARAARLTEAGFDLSDRDRRFGPMGWQILDDPDAGGSFSDGAEGKPPTLSVFANSATTRPVATKLFYLKPGTYRFSAKLASIDRGDGGYIRWQVRCPMDETGLPFWTMDSISVTTEAQIMVPASCPAQILDIIVSGGKGQVGMEANVASISFKPGG